MKYKLNNDLKNDSDSGYFLRDDQTKILKLTMNECIYLDDCFTTLLDSKYVQGLTTSRPLSYTASLPVTIDLIKKIGLAYLVILNNKVKKKFAYVELDENELLTLRELSQSYVVIDDEKVGISLKNKVLSLLLESDIDHEINSQNFRYWIQGVKKDKPLIVKEKVKNKVKRNKSN